MIAARAQKLIEMTSSQALGFYERYVLPRIKGDKKNLSYIGSAVAATLLYTLYRKICLPPVALRKAPRLNMLTYVISVLKGTNAVDQLKSLYAPLIKQTGGFYVKKHRAGWALMVTDPAAVKKILLKADLFPKAPNHFGKEGSLLSGMLRHPNIITEVGASWKVHRKAANPAFHRSMPIKLFGKLAQQLFQEIDKQNGDLDMASYMERYGFDAITAAGFGYNANAIGDKNSEWVKLYSTLVEGAFTPFYFLFPIFDTNLRWLIPSRDQLHKDLDVFLSRINDVIVEKRALIANKGGINSLDDNEKDLCTLMIEAEEGEGGILTNEEMMNDLVTFILAGHDTTANALSSALYFLAINKDAQQKLREEAIEWLGDEPNDVIPTVEQTKDMPYVNMVIKETLRIMGPAPFTGPRIATEDTDLGNYFIPKDTIVCVDIAGLQHDENIWEEPYKFDPERFNPNSDSKRILNSWLPFGSGQRQCVGMNMSLAEQRVVLIMMARRYEWRLPENSVHRDGLCVKGTDVIGPDTLVLDFKRRY